MSLRDLVHGLRVVAIPSPTLPPATHTNTYVLGHGEVAVVDPGGDRREDYVRMLEQLRAGGERVAGIWLTHHHGDHVAGLKMLRELLPEDVPVRAHPWTARDLTPRHGPLQGDLEEGEGTLPDGTPVRILATPGHAPGHLIFGLPGGHWVVGDMVATVGTILIDPVEGDLAQYLESLERMRQLHAVALYPAHGEPIEAAEALLSGYIAHRHMRTQQIHQALETEGIQDEISLAARIYPELPTDVLGLAAAQILTHLLWMERHGLARRAGDGWSA